MEYSILKFCELPDYMFHLEILKNIDSCWPKELTFRDLFLLQMPVTQKLLRHLQRFKKTRAPEWVYLIYPEVAEILHKNDDSLILKLNLSTIMKLETALHPNAIPYPRLQWLQQIAEATKSFKTSKFDDIVVSNDNVVTFTCVGTHYTCSIRVTMTDDFPFESPNVDGNYVKEWRYEWNRGKTTLKKLFKSYKKYLSKFELAFDYISSLCGYATKIPLIDPVTQIPIKLNQMQRLNLVGDGDAIEIYCRVFDSPKTARIFISFDEEHESPKFIQLLPAKRMINVVDDADWDNDFSLEENLITCLIKAGEGGDETMSE